MDFATVLASESKFWLKVRISAGDDCWTWKSTCSSFGYGRFKVLPEVEAGAHRVSWALANGRWPDLMVLHRCGNPPCVRPDHLYEGTARENAEDARRHGTLRQGERHANSKVTDEQVQMIRDRYAAGESQSEIARDIGLSSVQVSNIVRGAQRGGQPVEQPEQLPKYRLVCVQCGQDFYRKPGGRKVRFCSRACIAASQQRGELRTCAVCRCEFRRPPSAKAVTCSYECMGKLQSTTGSTRGERNGNAKVTDVQRTEIRRRLAKGDRQIDLAREFGLSRDQIARICKPQLA